VVVWLVTVGSCAGGLVAALLGIRPLTPGLSPGCRRGPGLPAWFRTIGLVLAVRRPANPISWLFGASGLVWSLIIPWNPWVSHLVVSGRSLPLAAQVVAVYGEFL
jgi:hypothetical protein